MKYALVTGGTRGIGRATCLKLASMGYNILINFLSNQERADELLAEVKAIGVQAELLKFDIGDQPAVENSILGWIEKNPTCNIDILVNNAGVRADGLLMLMSNDEWNYVMNANIGGFYNVTRLIIREMVKKRYGRIVNIVSVAGMKGSAGQTHYSASKAAIIGATKALAQEVGKKNIMVNAIAPGYIRTEMIADLPENELKKTIPMNRFGEAEEVAELAGFLSSPQCSYLTGQIISINGGVYT
jgi:3-oxoacyl-[acyl-carrier protein] reductase